MKLNGTGLNAVKKIAYIRSGTIALLVGLALAVCGVWFAAQPKTERIEVPVVISEIWENPDPDGAGHVYVDYEEPDGTAHSHVRYDSYASTWKVGREIMVSYKPGDPEQLNDAAPSALLIAILLAAGVLAAAFGAYRLYGAFKGRGQTGDEYNRPELMPDDPEAERRLRESDEQFMRCSLHPAGKLNQGFVLEDESGGVLYEVTPERVTLFRPMTFEFVNHRTGTIEKHDISHTVSIGEKFGEGRYTFGVTTKSWCKVDGKNCWENLAEKGFGIDVNLEGMKLSFDVKRFGVKVACLEGVAPGSLNQDASAASSLLHAAGWYRVQIRPSELDGVMLAAVCVSRAAKIYQH